MTSPADELRTAATKLRALATDATGGPWHTHDPNIRWGEDHDHRLVGEGKILARFNSARNGPLNATYTAAMHPDVGKALADLLDDQADGDDEGVINPWALDVARAINGDQP